nr:sigma-70 family RNA polymerase sigma factor [Nocardioides thalensis]
MTSPLGARRSRPDVQEAFAELFSGNFQSLVRLAAVMGADDPENVAQEVFARLLLRRDLLADPNAAIRYARAMVCNMSRSRLRHLRVARRAMPRLVPESAPPADHLLMSADASMRVVAAVQALPARQREVIVLRYWMGLPESEIAHTLGISPGSVKTHAARAMAALKKQAEVLQ